MKAPPYCQKPVFCNVIQGITQRNSRIIVKNSFLSELNILKRELYVKSKKTIEDYELKSSIIG